MFKSFVLLVLAVSVCLVATDPIRQKPLRRRVAARQQLAPTSTGYPPAGVTPEVPFELPSETEQPDTVYEAPEVEPEPQPDVIYGPPESATQQSDIVEPEPDVVYGPPETEAQEPDTVYGPPETESNPEGLPKSEGELEEEAEDVDEVEGEIFVDEDGSIIAISTTFDQTNNDEKPARLVYQRFPQRRQPHSSVPARLTKAKLLKSRNPVNSARYHRI